MLQDRQHVLRHALLGNHADGRPKQEVHAALQAPGGPNPWSFPHFLSPVRRKRYSSHGAYAQSKLGLVLFTYYLQEQLSAGGFPVTVAAVDPGMVDTALYDNLWSLAQAAKKPVAKMLFRVAFPPQIVVFCSFFFKITLSVTSTFCFSATVKPFLPVISQKHFRGNSEAQIST